MKENIAHKYAKEVSIAVMEHSGYMASIMAAAKLPDNGTVHALPPGIKIPVVPIHCLPGCPDDWVRESGSYVVPVYPDIGLWFDWTANDQFNTAIVPSLKGMNPITGQKMEGCQMEQYRDICPVHKISFAHGRYCEECKYSWPPQNYVGGGAVTLWYDGFYQSDGTVRQFFYTEEEKKDVATALIGKPNTMPAFGFAFFKYKHERPVETYRRRSISVDQWGQNYVTYGLKSSDDYSTGVFYKQSNLTLCATKGGSNRHKILTKGGGSSAGNVNAQTAWGFGSYEKSPDSDGDIATLTSSNSTPGAAMSEKRSMVSSLNYSADHINVISEEEGRALRPDMYEKAETTKEVSIGAGAAIHQALMVDTRPLADYHPEPQALLRIYFCFEKQFREIVEKGGIKKLEQQKNGFLQGVPVGG